MSSIENGIIKLQGMEQLIVRLSATEGKGNKEMFLVLTNVINEIIEELENSG